MAENLGKQLFSINPAISFVVGPQHIQNLPNIITTDEKTLLIGEGMPFPVATNFGRQLKRKQCTAFVSIMQGCNMRCSYCIVPKTRGKEYYRPMDDIIAEIKFLAQHGIKEVMLLGQIVNNYGGRPHPGIKPAFVQLLEMVNDIDGIERIRYMSPHPYYYSPELIEAHGTLNKLCPHVHLPIQSGSNRILRDMKRVYTREQIIDIVSSLRAQSPYMSITTDIIVGYPGETEDDFKETVDIFDKLQFDMAYIFKYSPRSGTKSAMLLDDISAAEKEKRNQILLKSTEKYSIESNKTLVGQTVKVLVEGPARYGPGKMFGWTDNHHKVIFDGNENDIGTIIPVKIKLSGDLNNIKIKPI